MTKKIFLIAGEESGDAIAAKLMKAIKIQQQDVKFYGIGGSRMKLQGLETIFPMSELSLIGFFEVLLHLPNILRRIKLTVNYIKEIMPDVLVTIDSPGFCFRVAKKIKKYQLNQIKLIHYVAPSVWAYKASRAKKIAKLYDYLITILPFEPPFFLKEGMQCSYVGHPIIEDVDEGLNDFRQRYNFRDDDKIICIAPGSRTTELNRLLPIFTETARIVKNNIPKIKFIILTLPNFVPMVQNAFVAENLDVLIISSINEKKQAISSSNIALVKSGTITLEFAKANIPMIVAYKVNFFSALIMKYLITIPYVSLVNIILAKKIIPEFLQNQCRPNILAKALLELLTNEVHQQFQLNNFRLVFVQLCCDDDLPSTKAAKIILELS